MGRGRWTFQTNREEHLKAFHERVQKRKDRKKALAKKHRSEWFKVYRRKRAIRQRKEVAELLSLIKHSMKEW
jgi:hypothetical protein